MDINDNNSKYSRVLANRNEKPSPVDVPIFTEEFLQHNKLRDQELRTLRAFTQEYEEENAILSKHVDSIQATVDKLTLEENNQTEVQALLDATLDKLKHKLVDSFQTIPLPRHFATDALNGNPDDHQSMEASEQLFQGQLSMVNIDQFMTSLSRMSPEALANNDQFHQKIKSAVSILQEMAF